MTGNLLEQLEDACGIVGIQVAGRFVGQEKGGTVDERAGDGGALHLATAHLVRKGMGAFGESDEVEHFRRPRASVACAVAAKEQRKFDVLDRGHGRQEIEKLKDDAEAFAPVDGERGIIGPVQGEVHDKDFAGGGLIEAAEQIEEGAFAAAARPGHRTERERLDGQRDVTKGVHFAGGGGIKA